MTTPIEALATLMELCDPQTDRELSEQNAAFIVIQSALTASADPTQQIVAWLRMDDPVSPLADAIERGDHLKEKP